MGWCCSEDVKIFSMVKRLFIMNPVLITNAAVSLDTKDNLLLEVRCWKLVVDRQVLFLAWKLEQHLDS